MGATTYKLDTSHKPATKRFKEKIELTEKKAI